MLFHVRLQSKLMLALTDLAVIQFSFNILAQLVKHKKVALFVEMIVVGY